MHTPATITKGKGFIAISAPREWYKGCMMEMSGTHVYVYDMSGERQQGVWCASSFERAKEWVDQILGEEENEIHPNWKNTYEIWKKEESAAFRKAELYS